MEKRNVCIVGGGASGLLCAILIKKFIPSLDVLVLELQDKVGKKLLQTGNGKGNISNSYIQDDDYNVNGLINLSSIDLQTIFDDLGLKTKVDSEGRVYPYSEKASTILDILLLNIEKLRITVKTSCEVINVKKKEKFMITCKTGDQILSDYIVLATGGVTSINFINNSYQLATSFGHTLTELKPSLVALKTKENTKSLSGIRVKCKASIYVNDNLKEETYGEVLFKDDGLSGIAIFILSRHFDKRYNNYISLDLYPEKSEQQLNQELNNNLCEKLMGYFPKMINQDLIKRNNNNIGHLIKNYEFHIIDTYGFKNAQVTKGGINIQEININTNESKKCSNMYILGEMLDVDGTCGGFNLHYAFTCAYNCFLNIKEKENEKNEFA